MTGTTVESPEVTALRERLDRLPAEWATDDFAASLTARVAATAAIDFVDQRLHAASTREDQAIRALSNPTEEALAAAVKAAQQLAGLEAVRARMTAPRLDVAAAAVPLERADRALYVALRSGLDLTEHAYETEMSTWRLASAQLRVPLDPPLPTDLDREVHVARAAIAKRIDNLSVSHRGWTATRTTNTVHPLDLLEAAQSLLEQLDPLRADIAEVNERTTIANRARREAGLTWRAEHAAANHF